MAITTQRLKEDLKHNLDLLDGIAASGLSEYYDTEIIYIALRSISIELQRRGVVI